MITVPTTLILGAGASEPYGFPLGVDLLNQVCSLENRPRPLKDAGFTDEDIGTFFDDLKHSAHSSVDAFLEKFQQYVEIGKAAMAATLIPCEDPTRLFPPQVSRPHWYEFLANRLEVGTPRFDENQLSVVTFNYDRSLEHYLYKVLLTRCGGGDTEAFGLLTSIPMIHVHGTLGAYSPLGGDGRPYTQEVTAETVRMAAGDIRIVSDADVETEQFQTARTLLKQAERIYFLGFGFQSDNVRRLEVFNEEWTPELRNKVLVGGTTVGIGAKDWEAIQQDILHGAWSMGRISGIVPLFEAVVPLD